MKPTKNPHGMRLSVDEVQLHRQTRHLTPTSGAISEAWKWVKTKPKETLILSLLTLVFMGVGLNSNIPTELLNRDFNFGEQSQVAPSTVPTNNTSTGSEGLLSKLAAENYGPAFETKFTVLAGVTVVLATLTVLMVFLFWLVFLAWSNAYWLRLIRGQDEGLITGVPDLRTFIPPMIQSSILVVLGLAGGFFVLIVPMIILSLGWSLVMIVLVDKNLGAVDAIKASWRLTLGYKVDFLILFVLLFLLNIVGVVALGVGLIVTNAIATGALIIVYDRIAEPGSAYLADHSSVANVFE